MRLVQEAVTVTRAPTTVPRPRVGWWQRPARRRTIAAAIAVMVAALLAIVASIYQRGYQ